MFIILLLVLLLLILHTYFTWNNNFWKSKGIAFDTPKFFFGNFKDVLLGTKHFGLMYTDLYRKFQNASYVGFYKLRSPGILLRDPELIKSVLVKDFSSFEKNDFEVDGNVDPLLKMNIFTQTGEEWKKNRSAWSHGLTTSKLKSMFDNINDKRDIMVEYLKKHPDEPLDAKDISSSFFTDVVVSSILGLKVNSFEMKDNPFKRIAISFFKPTFWDGLVVLLFIVAPALSKIFKIRFVSKKIHDELIRLARGILDARKVGGFQKNNPFDTILQAKHKDEKILEMEVAGLLFNFLVDGTETSAGVSAFIIYSLAANPDIQKKLREELENAAKENGGDLTYENIHTLPYLDMVFSETMRLYPPALALQKVCSKEITFPPSHPGGKPCKIEVGTPISIPVHGLHMDPQYFPDPERFDPERFSEANKGDISKYVYLPFGEGPRICIGTRYALYQIKIGIAGLVRNFEISLAPQMKNRPIEIEPNVLVYRAVGGLWVTFNEIKK